MNKIYSSCSWLRSGSSMNSSQSSSTGTSRSCIWRSSWKSLGTLLAPSLRVVHPKCGGRISRTEEPLRTLLLSSRGPQLTSVLKGPTIPTSHLQTSKYFRNVTTSMMTRQIRDNRILSEGLLISRRMWSLSWSLTERVPPPRLRTSSLKPRNVTSNGRTAPPCRTSSIRVGLQLRSMSDPVRWEIIWITTRGLLSMRTAKFKTIYCRKWQKKHRRESPPLQKYPTTFSKPVRWIGGFMLTVKMIIFCCIDISLFRIKNINLDM